jgi:tRNA dimethylallyltransferase
MSERSVGRADKEVLIAGPTASGKSALALTLAERIGGMIVNADSMQVYRDLRIITARPTPEEEAHVPHRLYGHIDAAENYSVGRYVVDAAAALAEARQLGRTPIFVGGTGLYFKALTHGLAAVPPITPGVRAAVRARLEAEGPAALHDELARRDPVMAARLELADRARIARALEVLEATGRSLAEWQRVGMAPMLDRVRAVTIFLSPNRDELRRRIDVRFDAMLASGALTEVKALAARGLDARLPALKAHGVPWLIRHLTGEMTLADAAAAAKKDTRHYTKRQFTWFRHQLGDWPAVAPDAALASLLRRCRVLP